MVLFHLCHVDCQVVGEPAVAGSQLLGLAAWSSRMIPSPSVKGSKATVRSCLVLNFLLGPEKCGCLVTISKSCCAACIRSSRWSLDAFGDQAVAGVLAFLQSCEPVCRGL